MKIPLALKLISVITLVVATTCVAQVKLPSPTEWAAPVSATTAPGDAFGITFPTPAITVSGSAPIISEWNRTVKPDESFTLTGIRLTTLTGAKTGGDTTVWVWGQDSGGGTLYKAKIWKVTDTLLTATLPSTIPYGMYLIWVENANGASAPVVINHPDKTWIGPLGNTAAPGDTKHVYGRNLSNGHGTTTSYVYIQPAAGGSFTSCTVSSVNPFSVGFVVPSGLANGSYNVYVHSGHGGAYGWSAANPLTVAPHWVRGTTITNVSPSGTDDTVALQNAINATTGTAGGLVLLASGTYTLSDKVAVKDNVVFRGAGKTATVLRITGTRVNQEGLTIEGNHVTVRDMTIHLVSTSTDFTTLIGTDPYNVVRQDLLLMNLVWDGDPNTQAVNFGLLAQRAEVTGCDSYRCITLQGPDMWAHGNNFYGGIYDTGSAEAGLGSGSTERTVVESNHFETLNWPTDPITGSKNYNENDPAIKSRIWCKRMWGLGLLYSSSKDVYVANNTSKDVACYSNKGEMMLLHSAPGCWFGQVASYSGTTVTVRTDGLVNGHTMSIEGVPSGTTVPSTCVYGSLVTPFYASMNNQAYVVVSAGPGRGEIRRIVAATTSSVTVESPFRVPLTSDSLIVLMFTFQNVVLYNNQMNAFPVGYSQDSFSASCSHSFDGNGFGCVAEKNTSERTWSSSIIGGSGRFPAEWNEQRDETNLDVCYRGTAMQCWTWTGTDYPTDLTLLGPPLIGNTFRSSDERLVGPWTSGFPVIGIGGNDVCDTANCNVYEGNIFENCSIQGGKRGLCEASKSEDLFRSNHSTVADVAPASMVMPSTPQPFLISLNGDPLIAGGNVYSGGIVNYYQDTGGTFGTKPEALQRFVDVCAYTTASGTVTTLVPLANCGVTTLVPTISNTTTWITATTTGSGAIPVESTGTLSITVNPVGKAVGTYWGYVNATTSIGTSGTTTVGVRLTVKNYTAPTTGLVAWYAADGPITYSGSNTVSKWSDQSTHANHVLQSTAVNQPLFVSGTLNGKPVVRFNGDRTSNSDGLVTSGSVSLSGATGLTMVVVGKMTTPLFFGVFAEYSIDSSAFAIREYSSLNPWGFESIPSPNNFTTFKVIESSYSGSTAVLYEGGTQVATGTKGSPTAIPSSGVISLGGAWTSFGGWNWPNSSLNGDIAEVLIYSRPLTTTERSDMVAYLKAKYALP